MTLEATATCQLYILQVHKSFNGMTGDVGMNHVKNCGNKRVPLEILSRVLA